jgi:L-amino acid N-acyltransferase YncA
MDLESSVQIRFAVSQDARRIAEIHVLSWRAAYRGLMPDSVLASLSVEERERFWQDVLLKQTRSNLVAEIAGRIVGWAAFGPARDSDSDTQSMVELYGIYLDPDIWRTGIGGEI